MRLTRQAALCMLAILSACSTPPEEHREGTGPVVLRALPNAASYAPQVRQVVYVPAYSAIYWGFDQQLAELAVTLSIRNVSSKQPIVVHSAKYFGSGGEEIRNFVTSAGELAPMATADFVIQRRDTTGGTGASFLVEWSSAQDVDAPVIEAVMVGQHGNAGISFTGSGRPLPNASLPAKR